MLRPHSRNCGLSQVFLSTQFSLMIKILSRQFVGTARAYWSPGYPYFEKLLPACYANVMSFLMVLKRRTRWFGLLCIRTLYLNVSIHPETVPRGALSGEKVEVILVNSGAWNYCCYMPIAVGEFLRYSNRSILRAESLLTRSQ